MSHFAQLSRTIIVAKDYQLVSADGVVVKNSIFKNTNGTCALMAGIDIEPDAGQSVNNVQILNSQFFNN